MPMTRQSDVHRRMPPRKKNARPASKPGAQTSPQRTYEFYHVPYEEPSVSLKSVAVGIALAIAVIAFAWGLGMAYQVGYDAGLSADGAIEVGQ